MKALITACVITLVTLTSVPMLRAADKAVPAEKGEKKAAKHIPFHGTIAAVDKNAKTIKVGERTFHVASNTKISKAGKPAILNDAAVGEEVAGAYHEGDGGKLELMSLRIGPKPEKK